MEIKKEIKRDAYAVKITAEEGGKVLGRAYLYIIFKDLETEPYGFLTDLVVEEEVRGKGIGSELVKTVIKEAQERGCYKLIGTSRYSRPKVHAWYEGFGFKDYGKEFRIDFK